MWRWSLGGACKEMWKCVMRGVEGADIECGGGYGGKCVWRGWGVGCIGKETHNLLDFT